MPTLPDISADYDLMQRTCYLGLSSWASQLCPVSAHLRFPPMEHFCWSPGLFVSSETNKKPPTNSVICDELELSETMPFVKQHH